MNHISIEGMDGVGKTTTCRLLAEKLGYEFVDKNLRFLFDENGDYRNYLLIRDKVNANSDRLFTSWFYGLGNIYLHTQYENKNIITDRYFLSNYAWSGTKENTEVYDLLVKKLGFPTLTVILYADEEAIFSRLKHRDELDSDIDKVKKAKEKYEKMIYFCEKYKMPYMVIDTSNLSPEQTVEIILKRIEGRV
ncbi:MAG: AAA family ATPase [Clostridia bacterium]|nr:AAA family ATPase [Clostridia bacterium]